jgi:hypothetical protein
LEKSVRSPRISRFVLDAERGGVGDACDHDGDKDGVPDGKDANPLDPCAPVGSIANLRRVSDSSSSNYTALAPGVVATIVALT